jgi:hypothetical protein
MKRKFVRTRTRKEDTLERKCTSRGYGSVNKNQVAEDRIQEANVFYCCRKGKAF